MISGCAVTTERTRPDVVFHLAAQSLVREGYRQPVATFDETVGTATILQVALQCPSVRAVVVVTSDKVYDHRLARQPYDESSALGGTNPYAGVDVCAEIVASAYRESYFRERRVSIATARAGQRDRRWRLGSRPVGPGRRSHVGRRETCRSSIPGRVLYSWSMYSTLSPVTSCSPSVC